MSIDALLARGRVEAEALMLDTCVITRAGGASGSLDDETGEWAYPAGSTVYTGKCKVQLSDSLRVGDAEAGEVTLAVTAVSLHLPIDGTGGVGRGMEATITSAAFDEALVGKRLHIQAPHAGSQKTARRFACEVVS